MDRIRNYRNGSLGVLYVTAMLLIAAQCFGAVTNGFFDTSLVDWQYDPSGASHSSIGFYDEAGNGTASLHQSESGFLTSSTLSQTFYVNPTSSLLSFQVRTPMAIISETDHFYIQLLDSTENPLVGNPGNDYFFHWKSGNEPPSMEAGWLQSQSPAGISIQEDFLTNENDGDWAYLLYSFEIPIAPEWFEDYITLRFELENDYDDSSATSILIDNVVLHTSSGDLPVVPVPGAMGLALAGLTALGVFTRKLS